jgi:hypothetical protein
MMPKQLVTVVADPPGKPPKTPAIVVDWDELEDGGIDELIRSFLFRYALGVPEGKSFESIARPASEEERWAWRAARDAQIEKEGEAPRLFMHDLRPTRHYPKRHFRVKALARLLVSLRTV